MIFYSECTVAPNIFMTACYGQQNNLSVHGQTLLNMPSPHFAGDKLNRTQALNLKNATYANDLLEIVGNQWVIGAIQ